MILAYLLLFFSIACEMVAASIMPKTEGWTKLKPTVVCIVFYVISFYCFGICLRDINLGIGYATWGAGGIIMTSMIGYLLYGQRLTKIGIASLLSIVICVIVLNVWG